MNGRDGRFSTEAGLERMWERRAGKEKQGSYGGKKGSGFVVVWDEGLEKNKYREKKKKNKASEMVGMGDDYYSKSALL